MMAGMAGGTSPSLFLDWLASLSFRTYATSRKKEQWVNRRGSGSSCSCYATTTDCYAAPQTQGWSNCTGGSFCPCWTIPVRPPQPPTHSYSVVLLLLLVLVVRTVVNTELLENNYYYW